MNAYNITDPTVLDYAECNLLTQSLRVWGSNPLVTLRFFFCAIVVPNVQYLSRNTVHKYEYGTKPQLCPHACTRYVRQLISRLIIIQKPLKSWVLQLIAVSFPLSQSMGLRCMSSNRVLFWILNERLNYDLVAFQIRITYQYSKKKILLTSWTTNSRW